MSLSLSKGIPLNRDLTHPQLKKHMEAAINIGVSELKARFGGLLNDEFEVKTSVEAFRIFNHDTWPDDQGSLLTFGDECVADLRGKNVFCTAVTYDANNDVGVFANSLKSYRSWWDLAAVQNQRQGLKMSIPTKYALIFQYPLQQNYLAIVNDTRMNSSPTLKGTNQTTPLLPSCFWWL